ncbi:MAG TPA: alpha-galactosidase [Pilimelia sp.]|nr:alpha-galactosidase [Pilimelia sp.]
MDGELAGDFVHLRAAGVSLVLDCTGGRLPQVVHWGADLGDLPDADLAELAHTGVPPAVSNTMDEIVPVSVLPEHSAGWLGTPGLTGHRDGADFSTSFEVDEVRVEPAGAQSPARVTVAAADKSAALGLRVELELHPSGIVRQRATLTNTGGGAYTLDGLLLTLPVPGQATELLDLTGRWLRERSPQRGGFRVGTYLRENRRGRTGSDATLVLVAGEQNFGFRAGQVWGLHVAWSGNHRTLAERTPANVSLLGGGEVPLPGEIRLAAGEAYASPWVYGSYGVGLDELAGRFHGYLRARPQHPRSPRPVTLNTWEAVYFDHDVVKLTALADAAAEVGAERFVLDDGWFRGRRHDRAGLGDWYVDPEVWPAGLHPLVDHVRSLGLQFGLWVEPEMINPDSDLAREHPDWIMSTGGRLPPAARSQQVLNLANPAAYQHILDRLDAILDEYDIAYLKWDHNRDLVDAGHGGAGGAAVHATTLAAYALMDELRARHPGLEIESCSSGGARIDLAVLERTDRVWTSDCIDALERQQIQRWTGLLLPPELMGAHVGSPTSHSTGRTHHLDFQGGTALFGHFGIEWDLTAAHQQERARLATWVAAYKRLRSLVCGGTVVHADHPDPSLWVHGVVSPDRAEAVYAIVQLATSVHSPVGRVRLPGLDPAAAYRVAPLPPGDAIVGSGDAAPPWWAAGAKLSGRALAEVGVQAPTLFPERLVLIEVRRI